MARLALSLLGPVEITIEDVAVPMYDRVRALLIYLVMESERPHRRDALAGFFWPDQPERKALRNLSQALLNLRKAIDDQADMPKPYLFSSAETIGFNRASDHLLDVTTFTSILAIRDGHTHRAIETCGACAHLHEQMMTFYRGDFLESFSISGSDVFDDWVTEKREFFHSQVMDALSYLANFYERRGEFDEAQRFALRQLKLEPWREEAHRHVMRALALRGQRNSALAQYEACSQTLAEEFGVEPEEKTKLLRSNVENGALEKLRRYPPPKTNLAIHTVLTPFIGRDAEILRVIECLNDRHCRLLTLTGLGGSGKTRLALQAATEVRELFPQGIYFVPLAAVDAPAFIVFAIAEAIGFSFGGLEAPTAQLCSYLAEKELLLILDNFEHVIAGVDIVLQLLQHAPKISVLVTSREALHLRAEWLMDVIGMPVPQEGDVTEIELYSAVELFVQTARRTHLGFTLNPGITPNVVRICQLVEGMPLGLELAAAWVRTHDCADIADEIEHNIDYLATKIIDVPKRQQSMRAVFDHSWRLLSIDEQRVFAALSVFRGGFQLEAATKIADATTPILESLLHKSLLRRQPNGRYDMHELLRQYVGEQLQLGGNREQLQNHHLAYFLSLAQQVEPHLQGPEQKLWLSCPLRSSQVGM